MISRLVFGALAAALLALVAAAGHADDKAIHVSDAWARKAPMGGAAGHGAPGDRGNGAVYARLANHGKQADALVAAASEAADKVELHEVIQDGGVMRMRPVSQIAVPAGGTVELKPGGYHAMLLGLTRALEPGQTVPVTLTFEKAGKVAAQARVR